MYMTPQPTNQSKEIGIHFSFVETMSMSGGTDDQLHMNQLSLKITGSNSRLQTNYQSIYRNLEDVSILRNFCLSPFCVKNGAKFSCRASSVFSPEMSERTESLSKSYHNFLPRWVLICLIGFCNMGCFFLQIIPQTLLNLPKNMLNFSCNPVPRVILRQRTKNTIQRGSTPTTNSKESRALAEIANNKETLTSRQRIKIYDY